MATRSPVDFEDDHYESIHLVRSRISAQVLPTTFSLRPRFKTKVKDQIDRPWAMSMAVASIMEYYFGKPMSHRFIYLMRNRARDSLYPSTGMYARDALKICKEIGCCREELCPSHTLVVEQMHLVDAASYKIDGFARVTSMQGVKDALCTQGPLLAIFPCYNDSRRFWIPGKGEYLRGAQAVLIIGWNEIGFIIRGMWGERWADEGHSVYHYGDWDNDEGRRHYELWTIMDRYTMYPDVLGDRRTGCVLL